MKTTAMSRRDFLKFNASLALSSSTLLSVLGGLQPAKAAVFTDYKALVCVFLAGGNDAFNMIVPTSETGYADYAKIRGTLAVPEEQLYSLKNTGYGIANMPQMQEMFNNDKLAIIANVGTLVAPVSKQAFNAGILHPPQLFSHIDQQKQWMTANSAAIEQSGWAARAANYLSNNNDFTNISVAGSNFMQMGGDKPSFEISGTVSRFNNYGYVTDAESSLDFDEILHQVIDRESEHDNLLVQAYANNQLKNISYRDDVSDALENAMDFNFTSTLSTEPGQTFAKQLEFISKLISVNASLPSSPRRQIFYARLSGFDHHALQSTDHPLRLKYLNDVLSEFQTALDQMNLSEQVTTFTASDFGRSLVPNGNGTDHGWGGHALVMGGAVKGGQIYGTIPELQTDINGYTSEYITDNGRVIPSLSVDQYLATLSSWFAGYSVEELNSIFPNLRNFTNTNIGFI